jgi:hypothetical protein
MKRAAALSLSLPENFHPLFQVFELFFAMVVEFVAVHDRACDQLGHVTRRMEARLPQQPEIGRAAQDIVRDRAATMRADWIWAWCSVSKSRCRA